MAELKIDENPSITDTIIFELQTPGADGSLNPANFDSVTNLTIFYVERGFKDNSKQFDEKIYDPAKQQALKRAEQEYSAAEQLYVSDPSSINLAQKDRAYAILVDTQRDYEASGLDNTFFYEEARAVHVLGTTNEPAWDSDNPNDYLLVKVDQDENGKSVPLSFRYAWKPDKVREGDYFICWTWVPSSLAPTETSSAHLRFWLNGNTQVTTAIPSHFTDPKKYPTLLERYTPETFKLALTDDDRTPDVIDKFNQSVALGFQTLEDLTNQLVDLLDANAIHESLLPYLSNIFGLKLKSVDPTKWRAQIKQAVPSFKGKGTRATLNEAFTNASMELLDLTIPWQIVSNYTHQESFVINVADDFRWVPKFTPLYPDGIQAAWLRRKTNNYVWESLSLGFVEIDPVEVGALKTITNIAISSGGTTTITCANHELQSGDSITISSSNSTADVDGTWSVTVTSNNEFTIPSSAVTVAGSSGTFVKVQLKLRLNYVAIDFTFGVDEIRFLYRYDTPPDEPLEEYLLDLPYMDARDDHTIKYPYKNWNVRLIEESDPYFDVLVPQKQPFYNPIVYGKIRTEFPYSENVYNMDEYNGSNRDSKIPCDIDRFFVDKCSACRSSNYNVDINIENLSDDRVLEAVDILKEFMPFHAVLNNMSFRGSLSDFTQSPLENVTMIINNNYEETIVNNEHQYWFNRFMSAGSWFLRDELASVDMSNSLEDVAAIGFNNEIMVFCPSTRLDVIGMNADSSARMQILAPIGLAGFYTVKDPVGKTMVVELDSGVPTPQSEPITDPISFFQEDAGEYILNEDTYAFNLFNIIADGEGLCSVNQDNIVMFGDPNNDFRILSLENNRNSLTPWKISISGTDYDINDFLPDGRLVLEDPTQSFVTASNITYGIKNGSGATVSWTNTSGSVVTSSNTGEIEVYLRGRVTPNAPTESYPGIGAMIDTIDSGAYYFFINTNEYKITGLKQDSVNIFYIADYDEGDLGSSVNLRINKRILTNEIGYFSYQGMKLQTDGDLETDLGIQNGANSLVPEEDRVQNDKFKENFIVIIDDVPYFITEIDGNNVDFPGKTIITLSGLRQYWQTLDAGGTAITFSIYNYIKEDVTPNPNFQNLPEIVFENIDRSGQPIYDEVTLVESLAAMGNTPGPVEIVQQSEKVSFKIEYKQEDEINQGGNE